MRIRCKHCKKIFEIMEYDIDHHKYGDCVLTKEDKRNNKNGAVEMFLFMMSIVVMGIVMPMLYESVGLWCIPIGFGSGLIILVFYFLMVFDKIVIFKEKK